MRGAVYEWHGRRVIPTFHPAAILRGGGEGSRQFQDLRDDFLLVRQTLDGPAVPPPTTADEPVVDLTAAEPEDEQLELF
jgi:hypothetical protein